MIQFPGIQLSLLIVGHVSRYIEDRTCKPSAYSC